MLQRGIWQGWRFFFWHNYNKSGLRLNEREKSQKLAKEMMATTHGDDLTLAKLLCEGVK